MRSPVPAIVLGLLAVFAAASPMPVPDDGPNINIDPAQVWIEQITYAGSGCKAGSTWIFVNPTSLTFAFEAYTAAVGPGISFVERRKNCAISFKIHYPAGYTFTLFKVDYYGRLKLDEGIKATQQSQYWFPPNTPPPPLTSSWDGPRPEQVYHITDLVTSSVWAPCGTGTSENLNVNTQVYLDNTNNPGGSGIISTDFIDLRAKTIYSFQWRTC